MNVDIHFPEEQAPEISIEDRMMTHLSQVSHTHTCRARHAAAARMAGRCRLNSSKETEWCEIILDESILMTGGT